MVTFNFKVLILLGVAGVFQPAEALKCHSCFSLSEKQCRDDPASTFLATFPDKTPTGEDNNCYTEFQTLYENIYVHRDGEAASENLDGKVKEGPYKGTMNPEKDYIHISYCKTDGCNTHSYIPPPEVNSTIKCYVCEASDDDDCAKNVASRYLVDADPIPNRKTSNSGALNATEVLRSQADNIAPFEWETYCQTRFSSDSRVYVRGVSYFKKGEWEEGECREDTPNGYKTCFCKSRDGCNDQNGSEILRASFFAVTVLFMLTNQVFLWGK
jgi:hypothetical protein